MRLIATVTRADFNIPAQTHQARCLKPGCHMFDKPQLATSEADARGWAEAHLTHLRDHEIAIEELEPEPVTK